MTFLDNPTDHAISWLEHLYSSSPAGHWVNLCCMQGSQVEQAWAQVGHLAGLRQTIERFSARGDVYFSVATRKRNLGSERGGADECLAIPGMWLDVDIDDGSGAHHISQLPKHEHEALALIKRFPLLPSAVIWSGHGLQPFWLLSEPMEAATAAVMLTRWRATWEQLAAEAGLHLDNVSDLPRMMRLPGTPNRKGPEPVLAYYKADPARLWQPSDLDDCLLAVLEPSAEPAKGYSRHLAGSYFDEEVACWEVLTWAGCEQIQPLSGEEYASHWHWPGASHPKSFTIYADGGCACWSESCSAATGIPTGSSFTSFGLYAWLYHRGDFAAARAHLIAVGWPEAGADRKPPGGPAGPAKAIKSQKAGLATPVEVSWLWKPWLPLGKLVTIDGDPAAGKSTLLVDLAARVTRGGLMPDGSECGAAGGVILLAAEDDLADTVMWRLMAAGANAMAVEYVEEVVEAGQARPVSLPLDIDVLEQLIGQLEARLVIIDVLYEYLDAGVDSYRDPAVRHALHQLAAMAARCSVCVVLVRHITKGAQGGKAIHAGGGSIGVVGRARVGLMVGYHPEDDGLRVLAAVKNNLAEMPKPLGFRLEAHDVWSAASVRWTGPVDITANALLGGPARAEDPEDASSLAYCVKILDQVVTYEWRWTDEVMADLEPFHFPRKTLERARAALQIESRQFPEDKMTGHFRGWKMRKCQEEG